LGKFYKEGASANTAPQDTKVSDVDHQSNDDLEWIVPNCPTVLNTTLSLFPRDILTNDSINVLEIGCGVSQLSSSLLQRLLDKNTTHDMHKHGYNFVSTDVSPVCIEQNRKRDDYYISSLKTTSISLTYNVLDILDESVIRQYNQQYNVVLDKGTLDTFLFRSKRTKKGSSTYPPILAGLLNNIHSLLRSGGCYIIISPRGKIKSVRDFCGFSSVRRVVIDTKALDGGVLVKQQSKSEVYIYQCIKNDSYNPEIDKPYRDTLDCKLDDEAKCNNCTITFREFRGNEKVEDKGEVVFIRRWKNHMMHCKASKE